MLLSFETITAMKYITRLFAASRYSWQGFQQAARHEAAFQTELFVLPFAVWAAFAWGKTALETAILISAYLLILLTELLNSAIEAVVDRIGSEHHELSRIAKDLAATAVFVALLMAVILWVAIVGW